MLSFFLASKFVGARSIGVWRLTPDPIVRTAANYLTEFAAADPDAATGAN